MVRTTSLESSDALKINVNTMNYLGQSWVSALVEPVAQSGKLISKVSVVGAKGLHSLTPSSPDGVECPCCGINWSINEISPRMVIRHTSLLRVTARTVGDRSSKQYGK